LPPPRGREHRSTDRAGQSAARGAAHHPRAAHEGKAGIGQAKGRGREADQRRGQGNKGLSRASWNAGAPSQGGKSSFFG
jgi:hypothetical protein